MPRISFFYGITIWMYWNEGVHARPHSTRGTRAKLRRHVDFAGREWRGVFEPLRDPAYFARVEVDLEAGTITWPDGLDMAPEPLYAEARQHPAQRATAAN